MSLTAKAQFRLGFLATCADAGIPPDQISAHVGRVREKLGFEWKSLLTPLRMALFDAPLAIGAAGLGASALGGAAVGHMGAKMTEDDTTPEDAQKQELIAAYQQQADRARRSAARFSYRSKSPRSPQLFK